MYQLLMLFKEHYSIIAYTTDRLSERQQNKIMSDIILHHYPPSPVSEKIRVALGFKKLAWKSVEQNRLPDRPELFAMTGGYRRIPVMQIGADIYCDTQCIFRELEQRFPKPSFHSSGNSGAAFGLSRWIDAPLFELGVRVAFAPVADSLPPELIADRTRLYFGPEGDMAAEAKDLPHTLAQLRAQLGWLDDQLKANGAFMHGAKASLSDLLAWHVVWFVKGRYGDAELLLSEFPGVLGWVSRMEAIGHGTSEPLTPDEALGIALNATPETAEQTDAADPQGLRPGMNVGVSPLTNSGETAVNGVVRAVSRDRISLARYDDRCGDVVVHFPRVGYRVSAL